MILALDDIDEAIIELRLAARLLRKRFVSETEAIDEVIGSLEDRKRWIEKRLDKADAEDEDFLRREYLQQR